MKVILLQDVPKIGKRHDVKEVNNGFAQNFLIPKKLVEIATKKALERLEKVEAVALLERKKQEEMLMKSLDKIKGVTLTLKEKATESGGLFSSIGKDKIVSEMKKQHDIEMNEDYIALDKPIKEVGEFDVPVSVGKKKVKFKLVVEKEE